VLVALFTGNHAEDGSLTRIGWWLTQKAQKGPYGYITHVEAIHKEHLDGSVTIASASLRDKGVRAKQVVLNPLNWMIVDVPQWDVQKSIDLLYWTRGMPYDWRGALATCLPGSPDANSAYCNQWVGRPFIEASQTFGPHHFAAICLSLGKNVTTKFFESRK
jgi:hypothetical protein